MKFNNEHYSPMRVACFDSFIYFCLSVCLFFFLMGRRVLKTSRRGSLPYHLVQLGQRKKVRLGIGNKDSSNAALTGCSLCWGKGASDREFPAAVLTNGYWSLQRNHSFWSKSDILWLHRQYLAENCNCSWIKLLATEGEKKKTQCWDRKT